jgi:transcriptional regulator with XRE-family HTH domain
MEDELAQSIGARAREARTKLGWSQADAAERIDISLEFYARIERGRTMPSTPTLVKMGVALGVSLDVLVGTKSLRPGKHAAAPTNDGKQLRLLQRRLRRASPKTLRLLTLVAAAVEQAADVARAPARAKPPHPKSRR